MTELILGVIVLASLSLNAWFLYRFQEQDKRFIKALISNNVEDFTRSELAEKTVNKKETKEESEYTSLDDLDDKKWLKAIRG